MNRLALDTSAAVPLLLRRHPAHDAVRTAVADAEICLTAHSQAETYSVLTRLPGDSRVAPLDAVTLVSTGFKRPLHLDLATASDLPSILAAHEVAGGAVYDAIIGLATVGTTFTLLTRDRRAAATYAALDVRFRFV